MTTEIRSFLLVRYFQRSNWVMKDRSTLTAAYHPSHEILGRLEQGEEVLAVFFDLTKAFDMVSHEVLLRKLE